MMGTELLLDTCAIIFIASKSKLKPNAELALSSAMENGEIRISPISAWEIGMVMASGRLRSTAQPLEFYESFVEKTGATETALNPHILIASSYLPHLVHKDPFDRMIIATARAHDLTIVTSDRSILAYGAAGHVKTLEC